MEGVQEVWHKSTHESARAMSAHHLVRDFELPTGKEFSLKTNGVCKGTKKQVQKQWFNRKKITRFDLVSLLCVSTAKPGCFED